MRLSLYENVWCIAVIAFIAYLVGDILGNWAIKALVVLLWSGTLILTGRKVGKRI
jgi:hypothetical protein